MGVGLVVGQELPFTPRGPPVICLLKGAGVGGGQHPKAQQVGGTGASQGWPQGTGVAKDTVEPQPSVGVPAGSGGAALSS